MTNGGGPSHGHGNTKKASGRKAQGKVKKARTTTELAIDPPPEGPLLAAHHGREEGREGIGGDAVEGVLELAEAPDREEVGVQAEVRGPHLVV